MLRPHYFILWCLFSLYNVSLFFHYMTLLLFIIWYLIIFFIIYYLSCRGLIIHLLYDALFSMLIRPYFSLYNVLIFHYMNFCYFYDNWIFFMMMPHYIFISFFSLDDTSLFFTIWCLVTFYIDASWCLIIFHEDASYEQLINFSKT